MFQSVVRGALQSGSKLFLALFIGMAWTTVAQAQAIDLLIRGGHVIDPRNGIDGPMDVAIASGEILQVAPNIPPDGARQVVDATGLYVTPGLLDMHGHLTPIAHPVDGFTFRAGVTTLVDAGTFGWRNFADALEQIENTQTKVYVFLAIAGNKGAREGGHGNLLVEDYSDYDPAMTAAKIRQHDDIIVGVKVWKSPDFWGIEQAVEAGRLANVPVMIDFGEGDPPMSLRKLLLETFRPGDIYTHAYAYHPNTREAIVDGNNGYQLRPEVLEARERGIIFDVGHGGGAFSFQGAVPAMRQGFLPDVISTDLHTSSMNDGMKDMTNVMSKFLNMGMSLQDVIKASTWRPAQVINREEEVGHLTPGAAADVAVFSVQRGDFGFLDVRDRLLKGDQKLQAELTILDGRIMWDLNGIAGTPWDQEPMPY